MITAYTITRAFSTGGKATLTIMSYNSAQECLEQLIKDQEKYCDYLESGKLEIRVTKYYTTTYGGENMFWSSSNTHNLIEDIKNDLNRFIKATDYKPLDEPTK